MRDLPKYVYFLRRTDGVGPIKIGCSLLPKVRLREFFRWSPYPLEMLASGLGGHSIERQLHIMFSAHRLHMEWFAPSERLLRLIDSVAAGMSPRDAMASADAPSPESHFERAAA